MRRSLIAAVAALLILAGPARPASAQLAERVIIDAVFWTLPVPVMDTCVELPAGQVAVTLRLEGDGPSRPVTFNFDAYKTRERPDPGAQIRAVATREGTTTAVPIIGGRYCYGLINRAEVPPGTGTGSAGPIDQAQYVALRMVLTPQ